MSETERDTPPPAPPSDTPVSAGVPGMDRTDTGMPSGELIRWLWSRYLHPHLPLLLLAMLLMAVEGGMQGALALMMEPMFDKVFLGGESTALIWVGGGMMTIFLIRAATSMGQKICLAYISSKTNASLRMDLLRHLMVLDDSFYRVHPPGYLIQRVQTDVQAINQVWNAILTGAGRDLMSLFALLGVAISIDWQWTLVVLIAAPVLVLPSHLFQRFVRARAREARDLGARLATRLDEVFHGIVPVKLNRLEAYQNARYRALTRKLVRAEVKAVAGTSAIPAMVDVMAGIGLMGVIYFGGSEIISGEKTVGEFMSFFTAIGFAFDPMRRLGTMAGTWQIAASGIERVKTLLDTQPTLVSPATPVPAPEGVPGISFADVTLRYGDTTVLNGLNLTIEPGQTTALVGASGAGKSTIFNVLTRLVDPQSGTVRIGGVAARDMDLSDLRGMFSVVSQDAALFDETLRENILLGREDVSDDHLARVLDAAHVADFLPKVGGLDAPVGPRGANLSGGQRQRVAIARALLRDTPILLLDEATSALDAQSEKFVQDALDQLSRGRTTLVIAHRLSTVRNADKIVVMDKGQVVDEGSHDELLARGGVYAHLHDLQFKSDGPTADSLARDAQATPRKGSGKGSKGSDAPAGTSLLSRISRHLFGR